MSRLINIISAFCIAGLACSGNNVSNQGSQLPSTTEDVQPGSRFKVDSIPNKASTRTIHVMVALCDNRYQGIVPVPAGIGNGQDPRSNLYWGAGYGVKSFFTRKSNEWILMETLLNPEPYILERLVFKHRVKEVYMLADAYDGQFIRQTTIDFLQAAAGKEPIVIETGGKQIRFGGAADLFAYIGHNGLMDFTLQEEFPGSTDKKREAIILACYSKKYFTHYLQTAGALPILWTTGLMAPEAYTLHDAIHEWVQSHTTEEIRMAGAQAYAKYQKCGLKAARNLLVYGW